MRAPRSRKSQLMVMAAMWSSDSSVVIKTSWYHPEIFVATPHDAILLPHPELQKAPDIGPSERTDGNGGVDEENFVWFSSVRFGVRFASRSWRFAPRQSSRSQVRLRRDRTT